MDWQAWLGGQAIKSALFEFTKKFPSGITAKAKIIVVDPPANISTESLKAIFRVIPCLLDSNGVMILFTTFQMFGRHKILVEETTEHALVVEDCPVLIEDDCDRLGGRRKRQVVQHYLSGFTNGRQSYAPRYSFQDICSVSSACRILLQPD
jgi:hypothetical protein